MNRLQAEWMRLFGVTGADAAGSALLDATGATRALVLEVAQPADWQLVGQVWRGVQDDLGMRAPAIAVTGIDGMQLWFALAEPLGIEKARAFLEGLRRRYLAGVPAHRIRLFPDRGAGGMAGDARHAAPVPALQSTGLWSAFVAPDLAPIFAETPGLDIPPGDDAQARALGAVETVGAQALAAALQALDRSGAAASALVPAGTAALPALIPATASRDPASPGADVPSLRGPAGRVPGGHTDPRSFLLAVMNDESVPLALRIDAAKALLSAAPG